MKHDKTKLQLTINPDHIMMVACITNTFSKLEIIQSGVRIASPLLIMVAVALLAGNTTSAVSLLLIAIAYGVLEYYREYSIRTVFKIATDCVEAAIEAQQELREAKGEKNV